jgi:hypothetical protein
VDTQLPLPRFVQIELVGRSRLVTATCPVEFRPDGQAGPFALMAFDTFRALLDQLEGVEELHLQGLGEPLHHPRFYDMVGLAAQRGLRVSTTTSLSVMTDQLAGRCVRSGLHTIRMAIDATSAALVEQEQGRAGFDKVLRNLRRLVAARTRAGAELPRIELVAGLTWRSLAGLPALVRRAAAEGAASLALQDLCRDLGPLSLPRHCLPLRKFADGDTPIDAHALTPAGHSHANQIFAQARREAELVGIELRLPRLAPHRHPPGLGGRARCDWPWRGACLSFDATAMPCSMVAAPEQISFGNMAAEGVAAVWNNAAYRDFRTRLAAGLPPEVCAGCAVYRGTI